MVASKLRICEAEVPFFACPLNGMVHMIKGIPIASCICLRPIQVFYRVVKRVQSILPQA